MRTLVRALLARDAHRRFEARFALLDSLARRLGLRLYNRNLSWHEDEAFLKLVREFDPAETIVRDRRYVAWSLARSVRDLDGDSAECGVLDGATSYLICAAGEGIPGRRHHVFDSFEGLSEPGTADAVTDVRAWTWQAGDLAVPLETVRRRLSRFDFVDYHPGWIPERFGEVADRRFCFVHVDVDLYQPTRDALAFFYERLVPGGILLCDDYGFTTCPGARRAFDEVAARTPQRSVVHLTSGQGLLVRRGAEGT